MRNLSIKKKLIVGFGAIVAILLLLLSLAYNNFARLSQANAWDRHTLEVLLENGLIAPRGRKEVPGRPVLWGSTPRFLEQFGLRALTDLPRRDELLAAEAAPQPPPPA